MALGAAVVEKHITLSRSEGGVDVAFSLEPHELKQFCETTKEASLSIGQVNCERTDVERKNMVFRRSIYAVKDIARGEEFTNENIKIIRPGYGAPPKDLSLILGKVSFSETKKGTPVIK